MKTLKAIGVASVLNGFFCICCVVSITCLYASHHCFVGEPPWILGMLWGITFCGWLLNPTGLISCIISLIVFLFEKKTPEVKKALGLKWIWIFLWPVITTALYLISGGLIVGITGGV